MTWSDAWSRIATGARLTARAGRRTGGALSRAFRRATGASGARGSGLSNLIELHAVNQAGDALVAVALAGTLFFGVPVDEARGRVALYLLATMAPFAVIAPLVGPALDRMRSGRRYALGGTMLARGLLCWGMASAVVYQDLVTLYPAAFGVLVLARAYWVSRSAVIPRVLPPTISLVKANARLSLAGTAGAGLGGAAGVGLVTLAGPAWVLRVTMLVFFLGVALSVRLPSRIDSSEGEEETETLLPRLGHVRFGLGVTEALRANAALRAFSGFLLIYLAFLIRSEPFRGISQPATLAVLAVAAGFGGLVGVSIGAWVRSRAPEIFVISTLVIATAGTALVAWRYGFAAAAAVAAVAGLAQALGKLGLDAIIQRDVREEIRTSAFARSETLLQLSWVVGAGLGLAISLETHAALGLGLAAGALGAMLVFLVATRIRRAPAETADRRAPVR